jgi:hypothetical protein
MRVPAVLIVVLAVAPLTAAANYSTELWNDSAKENHNWSYLTEPAPTDADMIWLATGGVADSGHVRSPLNALVPYHNNQAYWPAYLYRGLGENQEIDLSIPDAAVKIYARDVALTAPMDLKGGGLHFFIGQWVHGDPNTPDDDTYSFFYNLKEVTINDHAWTVQSTLPAGTDADWGVIASNDPAVAPSDLFYHPQQWGFTIFPASSTPAGLLALDSFQVVPEPSSLVLLWIGILGLFGCVYRRRKR